MLAVFVTAGEKFWLLHNQRQNPHWLLLGSDFSHVDQNTGRNDRATYNTAPVTANTITISSSGIFLQNFLGMQEGLHSHTALRADNKSVLEDASYLLPDFLRRVVVKQDVVKSTLWRTMQSNNFAEEFLCSFKLTNCLTTSVTGLLMLYQNPTMWNTLRKAVTRQPCFS